MKSNIERQQIYMYGEFTNGKIFMERWKKTYDSHRLIDSQISGKQMARSQGK